MKVKLEITGIKGSTMILDYIKENPTLVFVEIKGITGGKKRIIKEFYKVEELESLALAILEQRDRRFAL